MELLDLRPEVGDDGVLLGAAASDFCQNAFQLPYVGEQWRTNAFALQLPPSLVLPLIAGSTTTA